MNAVRHARAFFDTNVLVYADDLNDPSKNTRARALVGEYLRSGSGVVSTQVLQEYFVTVTRKLKTNLDFAAARRKVELLAEFEVAVPLVADILAAIDLHRKLGLSYWDSLVVRMASQSGCRVLFTEDLQHSQVIDGVQIVNPFL
jgi:predicted nucleic acid-binding protein